MIAFYMGGAMTRTFVVRGALVLASCGTTAKVDASSELRLQNIAPASMK
jgi:hypothetical protein